MFGMHGALTLAGSTVASTTFLDRLLTAYYALLKREGVPRINYTELARRVEGHTGIPVVQTTVTRWFSGSIPEGDLMVGLCKALGEGLKDGIDPGWMHYGDDSQAPTPKFSADERRFLPPITAAQAEAGRAQKEARKRRGRRA